MKSDLLQGIIIVKGSTASLSNAPRRYRKINVVSQDSDYGRGSGRMSSTSLIKVLSKLRSFN